MIYWSTGRPRVRLAEVCPCVAYHVRNVRRHGYAETWLTLVRMGDVKRKKKIIVMVSFLDWVVIFVVTNSVWHRFMSRHRHTLRRDITCESSLVRKIRVVYCGVLLSHHSSVAPMKALMESSRESCPCNVVGVAGVGIVYVSICQKGWCGVSIVGRMFSMFWCVKYRCWWHFCRAWTKRFCGLVTCGDTKLCAK